MLSGFAIFVPLAVFHDMVALWTGTKSKEEATRDFINIAAHELRTPTQAILGYSELLQILFEEEDIAIADQNRISSSNNSKELDGQKKKALEAIIRNVTRLDRLQKDILDITKIESNTLTLNKERFSLTEKIRDAMSDVIANEMKKDASKDNKNIKIKFESKREGRENDIFVEADKQGYTRSYQICLKMQLNL
jgi:signal transduction histidine kinase